MLGGYFSCSSRKIYLSPGTSDLPSRLRGAFIADTVTSSFGENVQLVHGLWNLVVRFSRIKFGRSRNHELARSCWKCHIQVNIFSSTSPFQCQGWYYFICSYGSGKSMCLFWYWRSSLIACSYTHRYIQLLELDKRVDALEVVNERIRKRFKNPKLVGAQSGQVCKHAALHGAVLSALPFVPSPASRKEPFWQRLGAWNKDLRKERIKSNLSLICR